MSTEIDSDRFAFRARLLILNWNLRRPTGQLLFLAVCGGFHRPNYFEYAGIRRVVQTRINKAQGERVKKYGTSISTTP